MTSRLGSAPALVLAVAFAGLSLWIYQPAFRGEFVWDDVFYIRDSPYAREPSLAHLRGILDPAGEVARMTQNWAPVHLVAHLLEWQAFGADVRGYHVVNALLHAGVSALFAAVLLTSGLSPLAAAAGALVFLVHPANVEAVAWISQLKSTLALALALGALLAARQRPLCGAVLFALALLTKATAAFALPVAFLVEWARSAPRRELRRGPLRRGLLAWLAILVVYALLQFPLLSGAANAPAPIHADPWVRARSSAAISMRYLAMATTGLGLSASHEPPPALSRLDPWWLGALAAGAAIGARCLFCLGQRREELAYWAWAAAGFLPVSQLVPFLYPMADRYLYFILPGLLGAVLLAGRGALAPIAEPSRRRAVGGVACALAAGVAVVFALQSHARAHIWRSTALLAADAARHYPAGISASLLRAEAAARRGDAAATAQALRDALARGYDRFEQVQGSATLAPVIDTPEVQQVVREMARSWTALEARTQRPSQIELRSIAQAHLALGELDEAERVLRRALAVGGAQDAVVRAELAAVARRRAQQARDAARSDRQR